LNGITFALKVMHFTDQYEAELRMIPPPDDETEMPPLVSVCATGHVEYGSSDQTTNYGIFAVRSHRQTHQT
jgi:hypothetical protein